MFIFSVIAFGGVDVWALGASALFVGLIVACWIADAFFKREFPFAADKLQIPLLGLILIGIIQLLPLRSNSISDNLLSVSAINSLSLASYSTRLAVIQLTVYFIFFAAAFVFINNDNRLRKTVLVVIIFSSLMAFYGILQRLANLEAIYGLRPFYQAIPFASFINQHHFAALMEMTTGITLGLLFGKATKNNKRIFLMIAVVIMGMAIIFTGSRGGMFSLLGVIGFIIAANLLLKNSNTTNMPVVEKQNFRRNFVFIGGGLAFIFILFSAVLLLGGDDSLLRGVGLQNADDISNGRFHFWHIAWQIFLDYPIFGAGLDAFGTAFTNYDTWNGTYRVEQAHNDYLQILADAGILGFSCVAAFIFLLFKQSLAIINDSKDSFRRGAAIGALAGCFGVLVHSFFDFPLRTPANAFCFLILTILATVSIKSPKSQRKNRAKKTIQQL